MFMPGLNLHIPDGFLSASVAAFGWLLAVLFLWIVIRQTRRQYGETLAPVMGVLAAFIFAAQAINFPVIGGTSGHLLGAALAGIVMGPWAGALIMTAVVLVQGLMFQDGGILVMGWNILNMAVFPVLTASVAYSLLTGRSKGENRSAAAFIAAWLSVEIGAVATALELAASGTFPLYLSLPSLTGIYGLVGLGEGIITAAAIRLLRASRPEVLQQGERAPGRGTASFATVGLLFALVVALFSPLAAESPDGLEAVSRMEGFGAAAAQPVLEVFPDYSFGPIADTAYSTIVAMVIGTLLVFGVMLAVGRIAARVEE